MRKGPIVFNHPSNQRELLVVISCIKINQPNKPKEENKEGAGTKKSHTIAMSKLPDNSTDKPNIGLPHISKPAQEI